jgi:hypothetical protein
VRLGLSECLGEEGSREIEREDRTEVGIGSI